MVLPGFAFHTISIDVVGLFPESSMGNKYLIVAINTLMKWIEAVPIPSNSAKATAKFILQNIICRHGCPQNILIDNGMNFMAKIIPMINKLMCVGTKLTTPYRPQVNGIVK